MQEDLSYPETCNVTEATWSVVNHINSLNIRRAAEIGAYLGYTTKKILADCPDLESLHIYDFQDRVDDIRKSVPPEQQVKLKTFGNSRRLSDSYCWPLVKAVGAGNVQYDFIFLDGAHTWDVDIHALLLSDLLLAPGGYIELDDFYWSLAASPTMNPKVFPATKLRYTDEQIEFKAVEFAAKSILKKRLGYKELVVSRLYQKPGGG